MERVCGGIAWAALMGESGGKAGILIENPRLRRLAGQQAEF
jgi:hypothetical protein